MPQCPLRFKMHEQECIKEDCELWSTTMVSICSAEGRVQQQHQACAIKMLAEKRS